MSEAKPAQRVLGTAQEEFDIATGYWKKWQRCEEEKTELLEAAKALLNACYDADIRYGLPEEVDGSYLDAMRNAIAKAAGRQ